MVMAAPSWSTSCCAGSTESDTIDTPPAHDQAAADFIGQSLDSADRALPRDSVTNL
jgi:hypothetical protein